MEEEYEVQHYGFTIAQLKRETQLMIHEEIDKACDVLVENIVTSPQVDNKVAVEIGEKKNILSSEIKELLKGEIDEIGKVITEHFTIPSNVTLSTDHLKLQSEDVSESELQEQHDTLLNKFMMLEQFMSTLRDELDTYKNMENLIEQQNNAISVAEESISGQPDINYLKELEASVKNKFNE